MDKERFRNYRALLHEIECTDRRMREYRARAVFCTTQFRTTPNGKGRHSDRVGQLSDKFLDESDKMFKLLTKYQKEIEELNSWYDALPTSNSKTALYMHYVEGFTYEQIARRFGNKTTAQAVRKAVARAFTFDP